MILSFGVNEEGQLGHGDKEYKCSPTPVADLENLRIIAVAAGWNQNFVLTGALLLRRRHCLIATAQTNTSSSRGERAGTRSASPIGRTPSSSSRASVRWWKA